MAINDNTTTRRAVISGLLAVPGAVSTMAVAQEHDPDARIIAAWNTRQRALAEIERAGSMYLSDQHSPEFAAAFYAAELIVVNAPAKTPRGILCKLWVALYHSFEAWTDEARTDAAAICRADFAEVEAFANELDYDGLVLFGAIRDLRQIVEA